MAKLQVMDVVSGLVDVSFKLYAMYLLLDGVDLKSGDNTVFIWARAFTRWHAHFTIRISLPSIDPYPTRQTPTIED